ncbi:hypothetical protein [Nocardia sp. A7]|uniref:ATP dependent DNA ligase n=1 Tax=Nocardia sp. A7 TaxID=2789274 RepID=UPI003978788F
MFSQIRRRRQRHHFGGLVLAAHTPDGRLRCIGGVRTGFTAASRRSIRTALDQVRRETSPLDDPPAAVARTAWWVEPVFVADIEYPRENLHSTPNAKSTIGR